FSLNNRQQIDTLAGFAAVDWDLSAKLTLQGAIRYTDQNHGFDGCIEDRGGGLARAFSFLSSNLTGTAVTIAPGSCVTLNAANFPAGRISRQLNENNTSWRVSLNYKPNDDVLLYANATKGYKSGSFPLVPAVSEPQLTPVVQESLMAFEAGFKAALADNVVSISGAGFYYQYKNKQIFGYVNTGFPFGNLPGLVNVPDSSVTGAELELLLRPTTALRVSLGATYIDSKVDKTFLTPDPFANIVDIRGEAFPNTPKWQFVGDAEYGFDVATDTRIYLGGSVRYRSSSYAAFGRNPQFVIEDYALVDLRAGAEFGRFRAEIWGRNVTNQRYITQAAHIIDTVGVFTGPPATYGLTLGYKW
ncbi:MAG: TonB-dependent receptor, partial [Gemmatimonadaceae bacterium]|nr:TonB-dependent receptor [Acetobacteraceae bacterium]